MRYILSDIYKKSEGELILVGKIEKGSISDVENMRHILLRANDGEKWLKIEQMKMEYAISDVKKNDGFLTLLILLEEGKDYNGLDEIRKMNNKPLLLRG